MAAQNPPVRSPKSQTLSKTAFLHGGILLHLVDESNDHFAWDFFCYPAAMGV
jgi:hypothetical protein